MNEYQGITKAQTPQYEYVDWRKSGSRPIIYKGYAFLP